MQTDFATGVWVIVGCGNKKYVGTAAEFFEGGVRLENALEFVTMVLPMQTQQGTALNHVVTCQPIDGCSDPATVEVKYDYLHRWSDMSKSDRYRHEKIVEEALTQMTHMRAKEAGLVLPLARPT